MNRLWWYLKGAFLCASLFVLLGGYSSRVVAQDPLGELDHGGGCTAHFFSCQQSSSNQCFCSDSNFTHGCTGCYIPNGQEGCGTCASR
jgi:hypothetical protein